MQHTVKTSTIRHTLVGNKIVDHSDVVWASMFGAVPTTSPFWTSMYCIKATARQDEKHWSFGFCVWFIFDVRFYFMKYTLIMMLIQRCLFVYLDQHSLLTLSCTPVWLKYTLIMMLIQQCLFVYLDPISFSLLSSTPVWRLHKFVSLDQTFLFIQRGMSISHKHGCWLSCLS